MEKSELDAWFINIRNGHLNCPFGDCTNVFTASYKLAEHVKCFCCYGEYDGKLPCTHCSEMFEAGDLKIHWKTAHKDVLSILSQLKTCKCPNNHCAEVFSVGFNERTRYLKHSITCQPSFNGDLCHNEYSTESNLDEHICKVEKMNESEAVWFGNIRNGNVYCPFGDCMDVFITSYELSKHVKSSCLYGRYDGKIPCTHCSKTGEAEELKTHWRNCHKDVVSILHNLKDMRCECPNYQCHDVFESGFIESTRYLKHSVTCQPVYQCALCKKEYTTKNIMNQHKCKGKQMNSKMLVSKHEEVAVDRYHEQASFTQKEIKLLVTGWKTNIKLGNLCCPVVSCPKKFYVPTHFVEHLKRESEIDSIFTHIQLIPCPYCEKTVHWKLFARHMQDNHREITYFMNHLKSGSVMLCPNYKCITKISFSHLTGCEYVKHALHCKPLFFCNSCGSESTRHHYMAVRHTPSCKKRSGKRKSSTCVAPKSKQLNKPTNVPKESGKIKSDTEAVSLNYIGKNKTKLSENSLDLNPVVVIKML